MYLKEKRKKKAMTMHQVADVAAISESAYCMIENGKRRPSIGVAYKIAAALDIPEEQILKVFYKK